MRHTDFAKYTARFAIVHTYMHIEYQWEKKINSPSIVWLSLWLCHSDLMISKQFRVDGEPKICQNVRGPNQPVGHQIVLKCCLMNNPSSNTLFRERVLIMLVAF